MRTGGGIGAVEMLPRGRHCRGDPRAVRGLLLGVPEGFQYVDGSVQAGGGFLPGQLSADHRESRRQVLENLDRNLWIADDCGKGFGDAGRTRRAEAPAGRPQCLSHVCHIVPVLRIAHRIAHVNQK